MATYNETLPASGINILDKDDNPIEQTGATVLSRVHQRWRINNGHILMNNYTRDHIELLFYYENSQYASSKRLKDVGEITAHFTAKSLNCTVTNSIGDPVDPEFPGYASPEARFEFSGKRYSSVLQAGLTGKNVISALSVPTDLRTTSDHRWRAYISIPYLGTDGTGFYNTFYYEYDVALTIAGMASANKPCRDVVWEDIVPVLGGFAPTGGAYIDKTSAQTFTFSVSVANAFDGTVLGRTTTFRWRKAGSSTTHTISVSGQSVTVPANTFPAQSEIEWRVECVTSDGISATSEWQRVTTTDAAPLAPTNLVPQNVFLHNDEDNSFTWTHNSPNGTPQSRAELQWSADGATWSALASVTGSANYVTVPANTLTAGTKFWRVRTYNIDDTAGEWSESAQIVLIGAPAPPAILELVTAPRAYVKWSSGDQLGWRVQFSDAEGKVFDSGEQYGDAREYRAEGFLADGAAHYSVAVANEYGWSVTEGDFTVTNAPSGTISMSAQEDENEALLRWGVSGTFDALYLLRGGIPIANVTGLTEYRDRAANGTEIYRVLGTVGANYTLSNEAEVSVRVETMSIFAVEGGETVQLRLKRGEAPIVARSEASDVSYYHFSGQRLPTAYTDGTATGALSITVTLRREGANELERFAGKLCCIRDKTGWRSYGILEQIAHSIARLDDVTLSFALTDYDEAVAYE